MVYHTQITNDYTPADYISPYAYSEEFPADYPMYVTTVGPPLPSPAPGPAPPRPMIESSANTGEGADR